MNICPYETGMLRELAALYNLAIQSVPHCYRVSLQDFGEVLAPPEDDIQSERRRQEAVFVAYHDDLIVGFIHVAIGPPKRRDTVEIGLVRFFWYRPGCRRSGTALLDAAERYLAEHGMSTIVAFPQDHVYWFYHLAHAYLSDHLGHVGALLGFQGYRPVDGEVFLDWRNYEVAEPAAPVGFARFIVEPRAGRGRLPGVVVHALHGDEEIGICICTSAAEYSRSRQAHDWLFTEWLAVEEEFQGNGLGKTMLQRALWEGRRLGYRHAAISTDWENHRAFLFYSNYGYRVADWTYGLRKESVPV